jgi:hypothetical protein
MAKKHMKKCSTSLTIKEMQIKTTLRLHLAPIRIVIIKGKTTNAGEDVAKQDPIHCGWKCKLLFFSLVLLFLLLFFF